MNNTDSKCIIFLNEYKACKILKEHSKSTICAKILIKYLRCKNNEYGKLLYER